MTTVWRSARTVRRQACSWAILENVTQQIDQEAVDDHARAVVSDLKDANLAREAVSAAENAVEVDHTVGQDLEDNQQ